VSKELTGELYYRPGLPIVDVFNTMIILLFIFPLCAAPG
jgi:hypothetical protein